MSVIGPRPLLVEYLPYYTKEEHHRHDVSSDILLIKEPCVCWEKMWILQEIQ